MNAITIYAYSFKLVRMAIGGNWYLVNDYNRNRQIWMQTAPYGYQIAEREYWE